jgi:hypothetical protein
MYYIFLALPLLSSVLLPLDLTTLPIDETSVEVHIEDKQDLENEDLSKVGYNCVAYVISRGVKLPPADAINQKPNSMIPRIGGIVIMRYRSGAGHVAYIESLNGGIHIASSNVIPGKITREVLHLDDPRIVGYAYY